MPITEEQRQRGLTGLKDQLKPEDSSVSGRFGFAAFGAAIQDALLKDDVPKRTLAEAKLHTASLKSIEASIKNPPQQQGLPEGV